MRYLLLTSTRFSSSFFRFGSFATRRSIRLFLEAAFRRSGGIEKLMRVLATFLLLTTLIPSTSQVSALGSKGDALPLRPIHTFSIVARDPATGELGVAVQSHWFSVGPIVAWAEAGVGAIATQSFVDPSYGRNGLDLMRARKSAPDTLREFLAKV